MKILIESTTFNHKLYHSLSLGLLEELKMNIEFGIVRSDDVAKKFLLKQKEIKYKFFENDYLSGLNHLLLKDKKKFISLKNKLPEPDYEVLDEFERSLDGKSIWKIISSDRFLGRSFLTGVIGYDNDFKSDRKFILKVFSERIKKITEIFKEFQPSIFLPMVAGGSIELFIYYYLCKKFNVFYAIHFDLRTKNLFSYTSNLNYTFPLIEKDTKLYLENKSLNSNITLGKELYKEIINNLNKSDYFNIEKRKLNVSGKIRQNIYKFKILLGLIKNFPKFIKKKYSFRNYILATSFKSRIFYFRDGGDVARSN